MSVQTLYTAATGMEAMETKLDVIANNLANINTTAFKKGRANFEDLFYRQEVLPGAEDQSGGLTATGVAVGLGTQVESIQTDFQQGAFLDTGNPLDVAIVGDGFLPGPRHGRPDGLYAGRQLQHQCQRTTGGQFGIGGTPRPGRRHHIPVRSPTDFHFRRRSCAVHDRRKHRSAGCRSAGTGEVH